MTKPDPLASSHPPDTRKADKANLDPPSPSASLPVHHRHTNQVIEASHVRAQTEQKMYNLLQQAQVAAQIYNQEIEPEHEAWGGICVCLTCQYSRAKNDRLLVLDMWSRAVKYPGEKTYSDQDGSNPYLSSGITPYGRIGRRNRFVQRPRPGYHAEYIHQTIALNCKLNLEAQAAVDAMESPSIWENEKVGFALDGSSGTAAVSKGKNAKNGGQKQPLPARPSLAEKKTGALAEDGAPKPPLPAGPSLAKEKTGAFAGLQAALGFGNTDKKFAAFADSILLEEAGRWPNAQWHAIVATYQAKIGMTGKVAELRRHKPIQYLHLLRAGYFEPIPVAWRGYEDTAEERLYFVLNHRDGADVAPRLKPDFISELEMARARMKTAVEPPPVYFSEQDTCNVQHTNKDGYSKQVMPRPFQPYDRPEVPTDDTMILLDVSGSMDFNPLRPVSNKYLIEGFAPSAQPKKNDVEKAIIRRFTPMLRLLLLLDGEAADMDEFELDVMALHWAHITIFLIGVDGCPHHHRHANELQRISNDNHHVAFVDATGNMAEKTSVCTQWAINRDRKKNTPQTAQMSTANHHPRIPPAARYQDSLLVPDDFSFDDRSPSSSLSSSFAASSEPGLGPTRFTGEQHVASRDEWDESWRDLEQPERAPRPQNATETSTVSLTSTSPTHSSASISSAPPQNLSRNSQLPPDPAATRPASASPRPPLSASASGTSTPSRELRITKDDVKAQLVDLGYGANALSDAMLDEFIDDLKNVYRTELGEFIEEEIAGDRGKEWEGSGGDEDDDDDDEDEEDEEAGREGDSSGYEDEFGDSDGGAEEETGDEWEESRYAGPPQNTFHSSHVPPEFVFSHTASTTSPHPTHSDPSETHLPHASAPHRIVKQARFASERARSWDFADDEDKDQGVTQQDDAERPNATRSMSVIERLAAVDLSRARETVRRQREEHAGSGGAAAGMVGTVSDPPPERSPRDAGAWDKRETDRERRDDARQLSKDESEESDLSYASRSPDEDELASYTNSSYVQSSSSSVISYPEPAPQRPRSGFIRVAPPRPTTRKHDPVARFHQHQSQWNRDSFLKRIGDFGDLARAKEARGQGGVGGGGGGVGMGVRDGRAGSGAAAGVGAAQRKWAEVIPQRPRHNFAAMRPTYVVPTTKPRRDLVWEVRNRLAQPVSLTQGR
ncbi:hypothetical protein BDK51DRAFT_30443 [Blyttiomyces helicus]|uniref:VWFA domain-containing protein n=1 Tax=Blyttiomyces helicus TaxID=388810 RepID=A0A4P9WEY7_9FUNG|nr:hypothetical protein BDK51DRAFT_30443 [Blyttiomyces helicus]|eukprot:RKO90375.1 hypothetical protein BDK51DRAFT_30443 [Blyttiomyces helicus]